MVNVDYEFLETGEIEPMIIGCHTVIYSKDPDRDRAFLRDVLKLKVADGGGGYLIFGFPAAEASIHETNSEAPAQELYFLCDDIEAFIAEMKQHNISCGGVQDPGWGLMTEVTMPSGGRLHVYQPRHARPTN